MPEAIGARSPVSPSDSDDVRQLEGGANGPPPRISKSGAEDCKVVAFPQADARTLEQAKAALTRSVDNLFITSSDVQSVLARLESTPKGQLGATLEKLEQQGLLPAFFQHADAPQRDALLDVATRAGLLKRTAGEPATGAAQPPALPSVPINSDRFPRSMQDAVNASTADASSAHSRDYREYSERYTQAAERCTSGKQLRDLGPPAPFKFVYAEAEAGFSRADAYNTEYGLRLTLKSPDANGMQDTVGRRLSELIGEKPAASVFGEAQLGFKSAGAGIAGNVGGTLAQGEGLKGGVKVGANTTVGPLKAALVSDHEGHATAELGGLSFGGGKAGVKVPAGLVDVYAWTKPAAGEMGVGLSASKGFEGGKVTAKVGVGFRGISQAQSFDALDKSFSTFDKNPPGLASGAAWNGLDPKLQERLERFGWTPDEWAQRQVEGDR